MPHKTVFNLISVWATNGVAWLIALNPNDWLSGVQIIKEIIAIISLLVAIGYTLYKWRQGWNGWNPRKKRQPK